MAVLAGLDAKLESGKINQGHGEDLRARVGRASSITLNFNERAQLGKDTQVALAELQALLDREEANETRIIYKYISLDGRYTACFCDECYEAQARHDLKLSTQITRARCEGPCNF